MKNIMMFAVLASVGSVCALNNGLGRTPQMGWNSWNKFACNVSESLIKQTANKIVELGLDRLGYEYVNIDDCWMLKDRDAHGHMVADPVTFPSGMRALGDYIHSKGLKFGVYSSAGTNTCEGRAGSLNHEEVDAADWASYGVDYLKYDNCFNENVPATTRYPAMRDALNKTGRPIFYSICNWGNEGTVEWGPATGNSWRTTQDIKAIWPSIQYNFRVNAFHPEIAGPGAWNDPDMLEIGNNWLTVEQEKTHFALWSIVKAPLILGCDLDKISPASLEIISNKELIDINQDSLGVQASCKVSCNAYDIYQGTPQVYASPLANGDVAVVVVNWSIFDHGAFELDLGAVTASPSPVVVRDLFAHSDLGTFSGTFKIASIPAYGSHAFRLRHTAQGFMQ
jgi:alpha-galactosidase